MKIIKIFLVLFILFISISTVSAEGNFTALQQEIESSTDIIEITQDYKYDNITDYEINTGIPIDKSNFIINGNGHTIDGVNQARIMSIMGENVTISNLNMINGYMDGGDGAALGILGSLTLNNVTFINNHARNGGAIYSFGLVTLNNATFINNHGEKGTVYSLFPVTANNCNFINNTGTWGGSIYSIGGANINSSLFANSTSKYAGAIFTMANLIIKNSIFENLHARETAGAIGVKNFEYINIDNCTFTNTSSEKNGGAVFIDDSSEKAHVNITNSRFYNSYGDYGGALTQLGGISYIGNCEFSNNTALYSGGAIYTSYTNLTIENTIIHNSKLDYDDYGNGGGAYIDKTNANISNCEIINNTKQGIYVYDSFINVKNTLFSNNGEAIHGVFINYEMDNISTGNDTLILNETHYSSVTHSTSAKLNFINNTIDVDTPPSKFDLRDWGWATSVKNQGDMGACWAFGACGAIESALLKSTSIKYDLSENNMQNNMLEYSKYGLDGIKEGGVHEQGPEYVISWFGVVPTEYDTFDELGKLSPVIANDKIHIQDVRFVYPNEDPDYKNTLKKLLMKNGGLSVSYYEGDSASFNENTSSYYYSGPDHKANHLVTLIGWDDNYSKDKFTQTPEGNGAWIIKNNYGTGWGDKGFLYLSYYDKSFLNEDKATSYILENNEDYTTNYQTDLGGGLRFTTKEKISYKNTYCSFGNELISGIGTYFKENENYTVEIYVNDRLAYAQNGTAPFTGFHTIKLTTEIPIKTGDNFTAVMKKATLPTLIHSRQHYAPNVTFVDYGNGWEALPLNITLSLKVYTKDLAIYTEDLVKIFKNDSKFEANIGYANETVTFEINGQEYDRVSDENGTVKIAINLNPGNYTIKTTFNGTTVENTITILPTLIADNLVKYYRNESQFYIRLIDGAGKPVAGKNITMNINGVFYNRTTNENGTARLNINLNPGEYILTTIDPLTGLQMSYNITVLPILNATDLKMTYNDGSTFNASVVDGQGKPLANAGVTFNINGVFYTRYTDSKGIARLNINLMPGEYIITSQYGEAVISNKITIAAKED